MLDQNILAPLNVEKVRYGRVFGGEAYVVVVELDEKADKDHLKYLASQLNHNYERMRAVDSVNQRTGRPVMRLSVIPDAIEPDYAVATERAMQQLEADGLISLQEKVTIRPLTRAATPGLNRKDENWLRNNAGPLTGWAWAISSLLMGYSALNPQDGKNKDWSKFGMASLYMLSNLVLMKYAGQSTDEEAFARVMREMEEELLSRDLVDKKELRGKEKEFRNVWEQADHIMREHPWGVSSLINLGGAMSLLAGSVQGEHKSPLRLGSAIGAVASSLMLLCVPQREGGRSLMGVMTDELIERLPWMRTIKSLVAPFLRPLGEVVRAVTDWLQPRRMPAVAATNALSNGGLLISAFADNRQGVDKGQAAATLTTFLGYGLQAVASPEVADMDLDDMAFHAAVMLDQKVNEEGMRLDVSEWMKALAVAIKNSLKSQEQEVFDSRGFIKAIEENRKALETAKA